MMPYNPVDPADLDGEDLTSWYLRSPQEIEQQRQAAAQQRYNDFFGALPTANTDPAPLSGQTGSTVGVATAGTTPVGGDGSGPAARGEWPGVGRSRAGMGSQRRPRKQRIPAAGGCP
jgi:hypothetical protein